MSENDPPQDDGVRLLNHIARSLGPHASGADLAEALAREFERRRAHEPVARESERRLQERRGLGFMARRESDAELNRQSRRFLCAYLSQLPRDRLMRWLDGVILGNATNAQLAMWVQTAITEIDVDRQRAASKRPRRGRPRDRPTPLLDDAWKWIWLPVRDELRAFSRARQHHFRATHPRGARPRRVDVKKACRATSIGQRVEQAGLFETFFSDRALTPGEMAARLIHREIKQRLNAAARAVRTKADAALSDLVRDYLLREAVRIEADLKALPSPATLHRTLQRRS